MPRPYASGVVSAPVEEVWALIRDFNGMPAWHPGIEQSSLDSGASGTEVGALRRLTLGGGGVVVERLLTIDELGYSFTYQILESPFAVRRYISTLRMAPITDSGQTFIEWWSDYDSEAADEDELTKTFAGGVYAGGIKALQEHFGS